MNPHNPYDPQHQPHNPQYPPYQGPGPDGPSSGPHEMPQDVATGFWLWTAALPLSVIGYVINLLTTPEREVSGYAYAVSGLMLFIIAVLVATFLVLLRQGYRWARSILTGGSAATILYLTTNLFANYHGAAAALGYAVCGIGGAVLIGGGVYLLHRPDSNAYFVR
ncbi:hypothetical protein [Mycolicibacterium sp. lyk4-40-TYG-92]|uniref:hypothetical protein n=1 Tax=Mycolicibacterium sp. lyk4-40-TYG-92 TaxID=3040295 RepID=UPI0025510BBC|nr:hypothetical protein [Mycolicibacterium sp. lyk4-40-TYG-92]